MSRPYDRAHFFASEQGYFVAIQSWIPEADWLPMRYASRLAFYRDLEEWIDSEYPIQPAVLL